MIRRTEASRSPGFLRTVTWLALATTITALSVAAATSARARHALGIATHAPVPVTAVPSSANPAAAYPGDTLLFVKVSEPAGSLDIACQLPFWSEVSPLFDALAEVAPRSAPLVEMLAQIVEGWGSDPTLRREIEALTGRVLVAGVLPGVASERPTLVVAANGESPQRSVQALVWLADRAEPTGAAAEETPEGLIRIANARGETILVARRVSGWLVFGPAESALQVESVAAAFEAGGQPSSLAGQEAFGRAMSRLPEWPRAHGFINTAAMIAHLESAPPEKYGDARVLELLLGHTDGVGFARDVEPQGIRTWVAGRVVTGRDGEPIARLLESVRPIEAPLSEMLPWGVLVAYDLGVAPAPVYDGVTWLFAKAAPELSGWFAERQSELQVATGLDPRWDLLPHLGSGLTWALLESELFSSTWPLPRPVLLARVEDELQVERFIAEYLQWKAGAVAALSGGLVSAMVITEHFQGVELWGLQVEGFLPIPLPSPTVAIVDGILVASPVRSAVRSAVASVQGTEPRHGEVSLARQDRIGAVELVQFDLRALAGELRKLQSEAQSDVGILLPSTVGESSPALKALWHGILDLMEAVGQASGATRLEGRDFEFYMEIG